ncbi:hypothetical protein [Streptomyces sp. I4(2020)]|uniref:hypothetical protein n=1 Tax=Streptomyces sp. I4(2020) TaxID=2760981 RepID=UPI0018EE4978|nr:hypothetical protein [Streptomyces sp. I4(2020)]MBJ6612696.1 hypothetical protein [Streptomyces sp. I3(2020)]MBJ6629285.1 hypothetical protein [Streptomyces sp. I4(2020)]
MDARLSAGRAGRYARPAAHERHAGTIPAVPDIISGLRCRAYTFVTVSRLMAPAKPRPGEVHRL